MALRPKPSLVTGTSSEFLGRRPMPRIFRERSVVFVLGPSGVGKSSVGLRIAHHRLGSERDVVVLDASAVSEALVRRTRLGHWAPELEVAPALILDGPTFLQARPGALDLWHELIAARIRSERFTVIIGAPGDGSAEAMLASLKAGQAVTVGLRFPSSRSGRMRFARRCCDELEMPRSQARGTDQFDPWRYESVIAELTRRKAESSDK